MNKVKVLFLNGIGDDRWVRVVAVRKNGSLAYSPRGSSSNINYVDTTLIEPKQLMLDPNPSQEIELVRPDLVFNQIADADSHSITLGKAQQVVAQMGTGIPCINSPEKVMATRREIVSTALRGIEGVDMPATLRVQPESQEALEDSIKAVSWETAVIVRPCGKHGGEQTLLIEHDADLEQLRRLDVPGNEFYLTEYREYADPRGIYRKYRIVMIDGIGYVRSVMESDFWKVHSSARGTEFGKAVVGQEGKILENFVSNLLPGLSSLLQQIYNKIGLDYFGIDCSINDQGEILIFEVNANMNILAIPPGITTGHNEHQSKIKQAVDKMIIDRVMHR